jgi:outer membrane protein assembly factor BamE (lipoprotein component of BamABCDE complex)
MRLITVLFILSFICGCASPSGGGRNLTVGNVQREIRIGMSGAEVAEALGSPNIVTTDEARNESWIYDKISTQSVQSELFGATGTLRFVEAWGPVGATTRSKSKSSSQRTLTVIVKFDENDTVRDFAYHTSRF